MSKTIILLLLLTSAALASVITTPVPDSTTSCTADNQSVSCGYRDPFAIANAQTGSTMTGFGTTQGLDITIWADAFGGPIIPTSEHTASAFASIMLSFLGSTDGPTRAGLATYVIDAGSDGHGGSGGTIEGLGVCVGTCQQRGDLVPFMLGDYFSIELDAFGMGHALVGDGGNGYATIHLQLFEMNGTAISIYDPPANAVPEPSTALLFLPTFFLIAAKSISAARSRR